MGIPFGISISDLTKAIKLSRDIYERCFNENKAAHVKYQQFIRDIRVLGNSLERFQSVLKKYESPYPRLRWRMDAFDPERVDNSWPQLIEDFYQTLQECNSFLSRHGYLRNGRSNVSSNLRWWLAEGDLKNLKARLKYHIRIVEFYTRPYEFDSNVGIGSEIRQLRRQVAISGRPILDVPEQPHPLGAHMLPDGLRAKLDTEFQTNSPSWSVKGNELPLKEASKALALHFARGTVEFSPSLEGSVPDLLQYLEFAKSIWLMEEIKKSNDFKAADPESLFADDMRKLEDIIRRQIRRFEAGELEKPSTQRLLELPNKHYAISNGKEEDPDPLNAGEAGPLEQKILDIQLTSDDTNRESALLVFSENGPDFRLVTTTKQVDAMGARYDKDVEVNMNRHRLVPAYCNPFRGPSPRYNVIIYDERGRKPREFVFEKPEDVKKLQRALTGYRVHHDMPVARWCVNDGKKPGESGKGVLQLWQFKPLPPVAATGPSNSSDANSSIGSPGSPGPNSCSPKPPLLKRGDSAATEKQNEDRIEFIGGSGSPTPFAAGKTRRHGSRTSSFAGIMNVQASDGRHQLAGFSGTTGSNSSGSTPKGRPFSQATSVGTKSNHGSQELRRYSSAVSSGTLMSQSSVTSPVRGPQSDGTEFLKPELPVLVIMTLCNSRYSFLHLTLDASIHVEQTSCGCRNPKRHCKRVILESKKVFTIRMLIADEEGDRGLENWDVSVFRLPRTEKIKKCKVNERVKRLELEFADEGEKDKFLMELIELENIRTANQNYYEMSFREKKREAKS